MNVHIRRMQQEDIRVIHQALADNQMGKPLAYIERCWAEHQSGARVTLIALRRKQFAGWLHLLAHSNYPPFQAAGIPEINNFEVLPAYRKQGVGKELMDAIEQIAFAQYPEVGIGVGMNASYGQAQRLYVRRGYMPDGRGLYDGQRQVQQGDTVQVGHDLALYLTKKRAEGKGLAP
ncbi:GNAT family N-acetyltransferase [Xylanibacillus composti]|uniref:N-acetyltransferase n=1 Tax=Xylanibacillus composti TaxID=1572762 RepID=A0A8J4H394_9BACL|nr:GNAT family N-acetyltransferase [Xylanibacillus composti]MDT9726126.1 GNAT family N-acetyltransferase [Xylanibacillus composti]GIQ68726.1 N-acetyltransferase [Xylanibacillus composti]